MSEKRMTLILTALLLQKNITDLCNHSNTRPELYRFRLMLDREEPPVKHQVRDLFGLGSSANRTARLTNRQ